MLCDKANPNVGRNREGSLYDTWVVAAAAALASKTLFNSSNAGGKHLCNLTTQGELGEGESFLVKAVYFEFAGTSIADITQIQKFFTATLEVGQQKVIRDQVIVGYPQPGGAFGIEGANGGSANGGQGWNVVHPLEEPILITGKRSIRLFMDLGSGAAPAVVGASGFFMRAHLFGTDMTAG